CIHEGSKAALYSFFSLSVSVFFVSCVSFSFLSVDVLSFFFVFLFFCLSFALLLLSFSSSSSSGRCLYFSRYCSSSSCVLLTASSRLEPLMSGSFLLSSIVLSSTFIIYC